ncbi:MAG: two-component system, OmpR family, response regulator [Blastocatellia bacterium]|jgi:DNA-binding response OmpR family regulator|nr:two-component system, OmpR family, response regulator [Blastocatellia bacterium]
MSEHCILVIEDQEDLAELYEEALKKEGYGARIALTGEEGLAEFRAGGADVILLDMTLPEMHGAEVLREIRAIDASVPVIIITGEASEQLHQQCERLGVHDYLAKPVDYNALLASIKLALETPAEEAEVLTLRLPARVIAGLSEIDPKLEVAIARLLEERGAKSMTAKGQGEGA